MAELDLLPPNAITESRQRAEVMSRISEVPTPVKDVWNPERCPTHLLPYLAWAMSVDHWNPDWDEATKRRVITASWDTHAHKGTVHAVEQAIAALGLNATFEEWFENNHRPRGTFGVQVPVGPESPSLSPALQADLEAAISRAKRASQHHDFTLAAHFNGAMHRASTGHLACLQHLNSDIAGRRQLYATTGLASHANQQQAIAVKAQGSGRHAVVANRSSHAAAHLAIIHIRGTVS